MKELLKNFIFIILIFLFISFFFGLFSKSWEKEKILSLSQLVSEINAGKIEKIVVSEDKLTINFRNGEKAISRKETETSLSQSLINLGVDKEKLKELEIILEKGEGKWDWLWQILYFFSPIILFFILFWLLTRQAKTGAGQIFDFTRARARMYGPGIPPKEKVTFNDVAGLREAKEELKEIVDFLKNPRKYLEMGAKIPRGVLLVGPPGCGKTLLARAVAGESNVPFFYTSGSSFTELFVGVGPSRVRNLFETAKKAGRAIIFIDEIDAVGKMRGFGISGGQEEREQTLNEILNQMDGFEKESGVIVMAASVTGDTPVLIKKGKEYKVLPISEVIDPYYKEGEEGVEKFIEGLEVLGLEKKKVKRFGSKENLYFGRAAFKKVRSVFRHKVKEIYETEYLGGKIRATGNHSVFVRTKWGLKTKPVSDLKPGDVLVDIPFVANRTRKEEREVRSFNFQKEFNLELPLWQSIFEKFQKLNFAYQTALCLAGKISQAKIANFFGVSQTTISNWQRRVFLPRGISKNYYQDKDVLPEKIKVTPELMRLFGYYVAEGYAQKGVDFCFGEKEKEKIEDVKNLMRKIFNLEPSKEYSITPGAINIRYFSSPVGKFFALHCGKGAKNKHLPSFLFEAPFEYFKEFLKGYLAGDGYIDKRKRGEITSVSKRLILELNWLFRMHGFKSYIHSFRAKEGRRINGGKPLKETIAWKIGFGKTQNPLNPDKGKANIKRPIVKRVRKIPYDSYVYDFCGCENEAFFGGENPILLHNTNKPELLDPALLRPGRFDRRVVLDLPDINEREEILKIHCRGKPLALNVNLREISERTPGFSGADLANLVNEAAIMAARKNKKQVFQEEFLESIDKVLLGPERRSHLLSKKEKEIASYHESGHAIVSAFLKETEPVRKISIIPRGLAAGYTLKTPSEEKKIKTKSEFLAEMAVLLGGYCAEKLKFDEITTGAANDLEVATELAKKLVMEYGMSELGPITFGKKEELAFLGRTEIYRDYSEKIAEKIDKEIEKFVKNAENKARGILKKKKKLLERVAQRLIEKETIERQEFEQLIGIKKKKN